MTWSFEEMCGFGIRTYKELAAFVNLRSLSIGMAIEDFVLQRDALTYISISAPVAEHLTL